MAPSRSVTSGRPKLVSNDSLAPKFHEKTYSLNRDKSSILSQISHVKKDISVVSSHLKELEFQILQNPLKKEEKFHELAKNVEKWSEIIGIHLENATYTPGVISEWLIKGSIDDLVFSINISCSVLDSSGKRCVDNYTISATEPCNSEMVPWLSNIEGNIERIVKLLKAYSRMNKEREAGLNSCKEKFASILNIDFDSGQTVVELVANDVLFYQIRWKLIPSIKHFSKIKNSCKIACTKEGMNLMEGITDLPTIKKHLSQSPIDVINTLAENIVNRKKSKINRNKI